MNSLSSKVGSGVGALVAFAVGFGGVSAWGQSHGVSIGKSCLQDRCEGDKVNCSIEIGHNDGFGDSITVLEAWDTLDPGGLNIRVPAAGNLPIASVSGNTNCVVGGSLPCDICASGSVLCPGTLDPNDQGLVIFLSNDYVIQPGDPDPLFDQASVRIRDNCNGCGAPPCSGCSSVPNFVGFGAATMILQCEDNNACTENVCVSGTATAPGSCTFDPDCTSADDCGVPSACFVPTCIDSCCGNTPRCPGEVCCADGTVCDDGNACTDDACGPNGCCGSSPHCPSGSVCCADGTACNDGNACTDDACGPNGCCGSSPHCPPGVTCCADGTTCNDGNACTADSCVDGCCTSSPRCTAPDVCCADGTPCDDGNACTDDACGPNGCCGSSPHCPSGVVCCADGTSCDDADPCTADTCVSGCCVNAGACECGDGIAGNTPGETCDPPGSAVGSPGETCRTDCTYCGDGNVDSGEACDDGNETNGDVCQNDCTPPEGGAELCRTPGFWATHACGAYGGFTQCEKANSSNITQTVINDCGGCLDVCGDVITNTGVLNADSALEAMCVSPRGAQILQLVRQLTAAALNCCISASDASCGGVSVEPVFSACNAACAAGQVTAVVGGNTVNCINAVDCFNNGGQFDSSNGACWFGFADNCHQRAEDNFGICDDGTICTDGTCADGSQCKPGPAGSSRACSSATANKCQVVNLAANCTAGGTNGPQSCP